MPEWHHCVSKAHCIKKFNKERVTYGVTNRESSLGVNYHRYAPEYRNNFGEGKVAQMRRLLVLQAADILLGPTSWLCWFHSTQFLPTVLGNELTKSMQSTNIYISIVTFYFVLIPVRICRDWGMNPVYMPTFGECYKYAMMSFWASWKRSF